MKYKQHSSNQTGSSTKENCKVTKTAMLFIDMITHSKQEKKFVKSHGRSIILFTSKAAQWRNLPYTLRQPPSLGLIDLQIVKIKKQIKQRMKTWWQSKKRNEEMNEKEVGNNNGKTQMPPTNSEKK